MSLNSACGAIPGSMSRSMSGRAALKPSAIKPSATKAAAFFQRLSAAIGARLGRLATALRHRRELEQLAAFSDRELRDLAVTRNDIAFALAEPFWRDPAVALRKARRPLFGNAAADRSNGGTCTVTRA